jgi:hypothetical protein
MMPVAANAPKNAKIPARQSSSCQPPKSSAVAPIPHAKARSNAASASAIQPRRRAGMILAMPKAAPPHASQRTMPMNGIIAAAGAAPQQFAWNSQGEAG